MSNPTPTPTTTLSAASAAVSSASVQSAAGVPLAVWSAPIDLDGNDLTPASWLPRLITEYSLAGRPVLLFTPSCQISSDQAVVLAIGTDRPVMTAGRRDIGELGVTADLVIALLHDDSLSAEQLDEYLTAAACAVSPAGRFAVVTRAAHPRVGDYDDSVSSSTRSATRKGFGFLQHVIITDPVDVSAGTPPRPAQSGHCRPPLHRSSHLDVIIFQAPAGPVANSKQGR